jgi:hypothetical protein
MKVLAGVLLCAAFHVQTLWSQAVTGLETNWDARKLVADAVKVNDALLPILTSLHPQEWYEKKGAPSTYNLQWQSAQDQVRYVQIASNMVLQHVDSLPPLIELYYRMEALESTARSLSQGADQYAPRTDAEKLDRWVGGAFEGRRRMREYMEDLATSLEQNFKIADEEAQRCRGTITKTPTATKQGK